MTLPSICVPTLARASLRRLLESLARCDPPPEAIFVAADPRADRRGLTDAVAGPLRARITVLTGPRPGPAAARNLGWRAARGEWVTFVDDDVLVAPEWIRALASDLAAAPPDVAGCQGRIEVPLDHDRRPTDWERNVKALETARYATADMAYRRSVLAEVGGFDERFERAYREDSDLALRVMAAGYRIVPGARSVTHPVGPTRFWSSVSLQAGNVDDALMRARHGPRWREAAGAPKGRRARHLAVAGAGVAGVAGLALGWPRTAACGLALWGAGTAELAWRRIAPGPRVFDEVAKMIATSVAIPPAASWHWLRGCWRGRRLARQGAVGAGKAAPAEAVA